MFHRIEARLGRVKRGFAGSGRKTKSINHEGHEGARRLGGFREPSCPSWLKVLLRTIFLHRLGMARIFSLARQFTDPQGNFMSAQKRLSMAQWDVFSSKALAGNSLAVFCGVRVRIFTVQEELPFAGHPTLGTAFALRERSDGKPAEIVLDLKVGKVPVRFEDKAGEPTFAEMTQVDPVFGIQHERETIARITGLSVEDFDPSLPIQTISTGLPYMVTPLKSLALIQKLRVDLSGAAEYLQKTGSKFFYFVTRGTVDANARLHARMLFYNGEDPATGSAAGCAAAWMAAHGVAASDERVLIEQGMEMQRPSRIFVRASRQNHNGDNRVVNVRVGGNAIEVLRGELFL
jgi:trans-2,3-dihydro-3-hydroxyanthranilate isomerase